MVPLKQLKPKSVGIKIKQNKVDICPADPQNSYFKQDVPNIILNLKEKLKKEKPVEPHIYFGTHEFKNWKNVICWSPVEL